MKPALRFMFQYELNKEVSMEVSMQRAWINKEFLVSPINPNSAIHITFFSERLERKDGVLSHLKAWKVHVRGKNK